MITPLKNVFIHKKAYLHISILIISPFSAPEKIEMILLRGFLSSGTEGSGLELWLAESESLPEPVLKMVLLILTGGAGGLSSGSPLSHIALGCWEPHGVSDRVRGARAGEDGEGDKQRGEGRQRSHQQKARVCSCTTGGCSESDGR